MSRDNIILRMSQKGTMEYGLMEEIIEEECLDINEDFEHIVDVIERRMESYESDINEFDDRMDGDHESAFISIGWGTDEDYGGGMEHI